MSKFYICLFLSFIMGYAWRVVADPVTRLVLGYMGLTWVTFTLLSFVWNLMQREIARNLLSGEGDREARQELADAQQVLAAAREDSARADQELAYQQRELAAALERLDVATKAVEDAKQMRAERLADGSWTPTPKSRSKHHG